MKCRYYDKLLKYDGINIEDIEEYEDIKKHIKSCERCRELFEMFGLSQDYICEEYEAPPSFKRNLMNNIDRNRYKNGRKKSNLLYLAKILIDKFKPVFITAVLFLIVFGVFFLKSRWGYNNYNMGNEFINSRGFYTKEGKIFKNSGEVYQFKGIISGNNVWGSWVDGISEKLSSEGKNPLIRPVIQDPWVLREQDFKNIGDLGCNMVYYYINFELFANDNINKESNILKLQEHIKNFKEKSIDTVVYMYIVPGIDPYSDVQENYKPPQTRMKSVFEDEEYYNKWVGVWKYLAEKLKETDGVVGYKLLSTPRVPSNMDGGITKFQNKLENLCKEIRKIDRNTLIFIPEYITREANPGEEYWDNDKVVVDKGEQGIIWETGFVKIDLPDIVYAFEFFGPYELTYFGKGEIEPEELEKSIKKRVDWADNAGNAPLVAVYGISRVNVPQKRIQWFKSVHEIFDKYGLSSVFCEYKGLVGAYCKSNSEFFGLYGQYQNWENEISITGKEYTFNEDALTNAKVNGFYEIIDKYFFKNGSINSMSIMDNEPILKELKSYWEK